MKINQLQPNLGPEIFFDEQFRNVLEDHMTFLRGHATTKSLTIEPTYAYKYEGDLSGLLTHYKIDVSRHWIIMRMNNYYSFNENDEFLATLLIPDNDTVEQIRQVFKTVPNKIKT